MSTYDLTAEERTEKRATWEAFEMSVCPGVGKVNVANVSHGAEATSEHTYTVTVSDGAATDCTCPSNEYRPGACKHRVAVESREPVMLAASVETEEIATDGGVDEEEDSERVDDEPGSPGNPEMYAPYSVEAGIGLPPEDY